MRTALLAVVAIIICLFGVIAWYHWDSSKNRGSEFGYYGEFNRVSNALASIRGITITQSWHNLDVSLEEFGFGFTFTNQPVQLHFGETDPIRKMKTEAMASALQLRIAAELASSRTN